jgi:hypothetical protein
MSDELPLENVPGVKALPLEYTTVWHPATLPPEDDGLMCVSTPLDPEHKHQLAAWNFKLSCFVDENAEPVKGVTFWTDLPPSPEHMAAHPEDFEDKAA